MNSIKVLPGSNLASVVCPFSTSAVHISDEFLQYWPPLLLISVPISPPYGSGYFFLIGWLFCFFFSLLSPFLPEASVFHHWCYWAGVSLSSSIWAMLKTFCSFLCCLGFISCRILRAFFYLFADVSLVDAALFLWLFHYLACLFFQLLHLVLKSNIYLWCLSLDLVISAQCFLLSYLMFWSSS